MIFVTPRMIGIELVNEGAVKNMGQALLGLVGWPVGHSASPAMMNHAFAKLGKQAIYLPFAVEPERLTVALEGLTALGAHGVNVTIPHKQAAYAWVTHHTEEAKLVGAVNAIRFKESGGAIGHNTDVSGWWASIAPTLAIRDRLIVAVLGVGGAAMAVLAAFSLYRTDVTVQLIGRNAQKRHALAERFAHHLTIKEVDWNHRHDAVANADVVVNTTPIGMWPNMDDSPIAAPSVFHKGQVVQDIVYRPLVTKMMCQAREQGAIIADGLAMLVHQGAHAFEWWFDEPAPVTEMYAAAHQFVTGDAGSGN